MSNQIFTKTQVRKVGRSKFDLTHDITGSYEFGTLYPTMIMDVIPGDEITIGCTSTTRLAPQLAPVMGRADVYHHYWYVPNRVLWPGFEQFIASEGGVAPYLILDDTLGPSVLKFLDYMGIKAPIAGTELKVSALPMAAYQYIFNEWYRGQQIRNQVPWELVDGENSAPVLCELRQRSREHDYFTSALPTAQAGNPMNVPIGDIKLEYGVGQPVPFFVDPGGSTAPGPLESSTAGGTPQIDIGGTGSQAYDPNGTLINEPVTIASWRRAFKIQEWFELLGRTGSRFKELIGGFFGVDTGDARVDRPEYITGVSAPVIFTEVLNTTGTADAPQGDMTGHAMALTGGYGKSYKVKEHGYIIGITSTLPRNVYDDGVDRHYFRFDPLEYFWPQFENIGEQGIMNKELYAYGPDQDGVFGYIPRYSEYKYMRSRVVGDMRNTLDFWNFAMKFDAEPNLNSEFIEMRPDSVDRIWAVEGGDHLWMHSLHKVTAIRPMQRFGNPGL